jgi:2-C-methyl-D-erythritol 4-phosphate cytidylyltransferase
MPQFAVIIPAAGRASRFGTDKLRKRLGDETVIARSILAFLERPDVALVVLPYLKGTDPIGMPSPRLRGLTDSNPRFTACHGGRSRAESVRNALRLVPSAIEWVAVHDAARPLVSQGLIDRVFAAALEHGAAVPALPIALTIKQAEGPLPARAERTVPRDQLWAMQTPQVMRRADLLDAFERCPIPLEQVTDDAQILELSGRDVWLVAGDERNLKITTPLDLKLAELLLREQAPE